MERESIKFRQPLFNYDGKFVNFHYWGYVGKNKDFIPPLSSTVVTTLITGESQQFIDKQDQDGVDIYEGDKVSGRSYVQKDMVYNPFNGVVMWHKQHSFFAVKGKDRDGDRVFWSFDRIIGAETKITGHIHENGRK